MTHIGFTGTRKGLTREQQTYLVQTFAKLERDGAWWFHHGDALGADYDAFVIALQYGAHAVAHPAEHPARAFTQSDIVHEPLPPLVRNRIIVDSVSKMFAATKGFGEQQRSGTWATIRYARSVCRSLTIILPDGTEMV